MVNELAAIGFASLTDICRWSAEGITLLDSASLTRRESAAVAEVRESGTARGGVQVKLHSKLKALEILGRHLGMFAGNGCDTEPDAIPALPEALRQRLEAIYGETSLPEEGDETTTED